MASIGRILFVAVTGPDRAPYIFIYDYANAIPLLSPPTLVTSFAINSIGTVDSLAEPGLRQPGGGHAVGGQPDLVPPAAADDPRQRALFDNPCNGFLDFDICPNFAAGATAFVGTNHKLVAWATAHWPEGRSGGLDILAWSQP